MKKVFYKKTILTYYITQLFLIFSLAIKWENNVFSAYVNGASKKIKFLAIFSPPPPFLELNRKTRLCYMYATKEKIEKILLYYWVSDILEFVS